MFDELSNKYNKELKSHLKSKNKDSNLSYDRVHNDKAITDEF